MSANEFLGFIEGVQVGGLLMAGVIYIGSHWFKKKDPEPEPDASALKEREFEMKFDDLVNGRVNLVPTRHNDRKEYDKCKHFLKDVFNARYRGYKEKMTWEKAVKMVGPGILGGKATATHWQELLVHCTAVGKRFGFSD